ncbi:hypothetical protein JTE90_025664, partial [Oedothorax gibbosus]
LRRYAFKTLTLVASLRLCHSTYCSSA